MVDTTYNTVEQYDKHVAIPLINLNKLLEENNVPVRKRTNLPQLPLISDGLMYDTIGVIPDDISLVDLLDNFFRNMFSKVDWTLNFSIDGPSAMAKSSMMKDIPHNKINKFVNVSKNNCYNNIPIASFSYITTYENLLKNSVGMIFDRSIISNIAYGICFYLMSVIVNDFMGYRTYTSVCDEFINSTNMKATLEYINASKYNVLIMIDSSYEHYAQRFYTRGYMNSSKSDVLKSQVYEYWAAQTAAFAYLANILNYNCIDLNSLRLAYPNIDDDQLLTSICESFKDAYYMYQPSIIRLSSTMNPQNTNISTETTKKLTIKTLVHSNR